MSAGFAIAVYAEIFYSHSLPFGLTSGIIALPFNAMIYILLSYAIKQKESEKDRLDRLFESLTTSR